MNKFLQGYKREPYAFQQYANKNHKNEKLAAQEVIDVSYTPQALVKQFLTYWRNNGPIQNFFDAFTSQGKVKNQMKKELADILKSMGYEVVPTYHDEKNRYATNEKGQTFNLIKSARKYVDKKDMDGLIRFFVENFPESKAIKSIAQDVKNVTSKLDEDSLGAVADYYQSIFPTDYASKLLNVSLDKAKQDFEEFKDESISDILLTQMESFNKGEQKPMSNNPNNGGIGGYDFISDMRGDAPGGVAPNMYEVRANKKKRFLQQK